MTSRVGYVSVCAGIEAATVAWRPLGWSAVAFAEIDKFPCAVLAHHYPETPNWGDLTKWQDWPDATLDLLVGGTPCQSFSVAGLRQGLADPRGGLVYAYLAVARRYRPRWVVWENVPGVLSSDGGRAFGTFLGALGELGYGWAYRSLDAQYFGLAQRRERVFIVGHLGDWRRAAAVLFERESLSGDPAPRREAGQDYPAGTLGRSRGNVRADEAWTNRLVPVTANTLEAGGHSRNPLHETLVAFNWQSGGDCRGLDPRPTAQLQRQQIPAVQFGLVVRRLTPRENERLQGFPDDYTLIPYRGKPAKDGPRYKALGNSMAVPVVRWIGERIAQVDALRGGGVTSRVGGSEGEA